jgi:hypothetical protein
MLKRGRKDCQTYTVLTHLLRASQGNYFHQKSIIPYREIVCKEKNVRRLFVMSYDCCGIKDAF